MTAIDTTTVTAASLAASLRSDRAELQRMLDASQRTLKSHGYVIVIRSGDFLMPMTLTMDGRKVIDVKPSSLTRCSRLTKADAETVCRGGNVKNGNGETAEPMHELEALRLTIDKLSQLINLLDAAA